MQTDYFSEYVSSAPRKKISLDLTIFDIDNPRIQFLIDSEEARGTSTSFL